MLKPTIPTIAILLFATAGIISGQARENRKNNPYSPSPNRTSKPDTAPISSATPALPKSGPSDVTFVMQSDTKPVKNDSWPTIAQRTYDIAKKADLRSTPATEMYKIGVGDVLLVNLKNSPQGSGYYTVKPDGTIDYPLAGEEVIVADQTIDSLQEILESGIKLFPDPQVEIKVRQYGSHKITVSGMVENPGEKNLQREAIPLYVIRAEAGVDPRAVKVQITRAPLLKVETYSLKDASTDNTLLYPGNSVEFIGEGGSRSTGASGVYFIAGEVVTSGQKDLTAGITLYQAVIAAGGVKGDPKKAVIRRKNDKGLLATAEYNLRSIKDGKAADPALAAGDVIEIRN